MTAGRKGTFARRRFPAAWRIVLAACLACGPAACAKQQILSGQELSRSAAKGQLPRQLAVLPFTDPTQTEGLADLVRVGFYSHLSALPFDDMELHRVDSLLGGRGVSAGDRAARTQVQVQELGRLLGADAVVFGEITEFERVFAGLYSQLSLGASIAIYDTRSGLEVWADSHVSRFHEGGMPLDFLSIPLITVRSGLNLRETVKRRAVDELCRELVARLPVPPGGAGGGPEAYAYEVQAGAFLEESRALEFSRKLRAGGFPAFVRQHRAGPDLWHRVVLGPYPLQAEAQRVQKRIRAEWQADAHICRVQFPPR